MAQSIGKISYFIISFFTMLITLVSFTLLSLQILLISLLWMFSRFVSHINYKLANLHS